MKQLESLIRLQEKVAQLESQELSTTQARARDEMLAYIGRLEQECERLHQHLTSCESSEADLEMECERLRVDAARYQLLLTFDDDVALAVMPMEVYGIMTLSEWLDAQINQIEETK